MARTFRSALVSIRAAKARPSCLRNIKSLRREARVLEREAHVLDHDVRSVEPNTSSYEMTHHECAERGSVIHTLFPTSSCVNFHSHDQDDVGGWDAPCYGAVQYQDMDPEYGDSGHLRLVCSRCWEQMVECL